MRWGVRLLLSGAALCALANTAPDIAPPPAWVKPIAVVAATAQGDAPIRMLLSDEQVDLKRGSIARYSHVALLVQTSEGLAVGNIAIPWRPDVDTLTIHGLRIRRGAKVIDVLADQKFTVLRRETNLEAATLDGRLTASLQVDGLEVGDVMEFEQTIVSRDPTLGSHVEDMGAQWNSLPIDRARARVQWAPDVPLQVRASDTLPPVKVVGGSSGKSVELEATNVKPLVLPRGAPDRFGIGRLLEATDYTEWAQVGALMAPLYVKTAQIAPGGPLAAQVAIIRLASGDPMTRASAALALVQGKIRYVALQMGGGGYTPAAADATWTSRFGDCKAKTAMLLAILHELGIAAVPVAVASRGGDAIGGRLPMIGVFDHVLVRATIAGKEYWLDGTRNKDRLLTTLTVPDFRWGLPLVAKGAQLVAIRAVTPSQPISDYQLAIDARAGILAPAKAHVDIDFRSDAAEGLRQSMAVMAEAQRDASLRNYFRNLYDFIEPTTVSAKYDPATGVERLSMDGVATLKWNDGYLRIPGSSIGYTADFSRPAGPSADAPFAVDITNYGRATTTVQVPAGVSLWAGKIGPDVDQTLAGTHYQRSAIFKDGVLRMTKVERAVVSEVPLAEARAAQARLRAIDDEDVFLQKVSYQASDADLTAMAAATPSTSADYFERGVVYFRKEKWSEAIADFTKANEANPKDVDPLANRGLAYFWSGQPDRAEADLAAAARIDPNDAVVQRGRGLIAMSKNDVKGAITAFTASLAKDPDNEFALEQRGTLSVATGDYPQALADADAITRINPANKSATLLRANVYKSEGKRELALAQIDAYLKSAPTDAVVVRNAAALYASLEQRERAVALLSSAIARKPEAWLYLNRQGMRDPSDMAGRRADLDAALKLEPKNSGALSQRGYLAMQQKQFAAAITDFSHVYANDPKQASILRYRGIARWKAGDKAGAERDFAAATAGAQTATGYNSQCWELATNDVALEEALAACDRAVAMAPGNAAYLDSRGMANLKLGRLDAAIADYDAALRIVPVLAPSLLGRSFAWSRKGDRTKADADRTAAIKIAPAVVNEFKNYGLTLP